MAALLAPGFADPVLGTQSVFRRVMDAIARPGLVCSLPDTVAPPLPLSRGAVALAALRLPQAVPGIDLSGAVRTVTRTPAEAVGLNVRGEILRGRRADLIRVRAINDVAAVRSVWRGGRRVA
jgi:cytosine/adenosine deaminase-related metal-dependent hydrolase